jgi:hypothetical protein
LVCSRAMKKFASKTRFKVINFLLEELFFYPLRFFHFGL